MKEFIQSPMPKNIVGKPGAFHAKIPRGQHEVEIHGHELTSKAVRRWETEEDKHVLELANQFYNMMSKYNKKWGY